MLKYFFLGILAMFAIFTYSQEVETIPQLGFKGYSDLEFTPDGRYIVSYQIFNKSIIIWDIRLEKEINSMDGTCPAISPDSKLMAFVSDNKLKIYDFTTGKTSTYPVIIPDKSDTNSDNDKIKLAFSPLSDHIVINGNGKGSKIKLFRIADQKEILIRQGNFPLFLIKKQQMVYADNKKLCFYDISTKKQYVYEFSNEIIAMALSPDGKNIQILSGKNDENIKVTLFDSEKRQVKSSGEYGYSFYGEEKYPWNIRFVNETISVFGYENNFSAFWNINANKKINTEILVDRLFINKVKKTVYSLQNYGRFDNSGLCVEDTVGEISEFDVAKEKAIFNKKLYCTEFFNEMAVNPNGKMIATGGSSRIILNDPEFNQKNQLHGYARNMKKIEFNPFNNDLIAINEYFATSVSLDKFQSVDFGYCSDYTFSAQKRMSAKYNDKIFFNDENNLIKDSMDAPEYTNYRDAIIRFSADGRLMAFSGGNTIYIYNQETKKLLKKLDASCFFSVGVETALADLSFSKSGKYLYSINKPGDEGSCDEAGLMLFDLEGNSLNSILPLNDNMYEGFERSAIFSENEESLIYVSSDLKTINWYDLKQRKTTRQSTSKDIINGIAEISGSNNFLIFGSGKIAVCEYATGKILNEYIVSDKNIKMARFNKSGQLLALGLSDNTIVLFDWIKKNKICTLITLYGNVILYTDDNYYAASKDMYQAVAFRSGGKGYNFEQFDLLHNRPDIILERLGMADTLLIQAYRKAYFKRLKKMNFSPFNFSPELNIPEVLIINKEELPISNQSNSISIKIKATDKKYMLDRFNVRVNDVPIFGSNGFDLKPLKTSIYETEIKLLLSPGKNNIQVSCFNEKGVESLKESFRITFENKEPVNSDLYLITIGVSNYKENRMNLKYPVKDGRDICVFFNNKMKSGQAGVTKIIYDTLFDQKATRSNILLLKKKLLSTNVNDMVIISLSGHGLLDDSLNFYYGTYDVDFANPKVNGLLYQELESLLDSIPARKKLLLVDACHSGEVDKDDVIKINSGNPSLNNGSKNRISTTTFKGAEIIESKSGIGLANSFELMQSLFTDLVNGTGATVISAAAGSGFALEGDSWNNGVFTYAFINGLKSQTADFNGDGMIDVCELKNYISTEVEKLTNGRQKPTTRSENPNFNWRLW